MWSTKPQWLFKRPDSCVEAKHDFWMECASFAKTERNDANLVNGYKVEDSRHAPTAMWHNEVGLISLPPKLASEMYLQPLHIERLV